MRDRFGFDVLDEPVACSTCDGDGWVAASKPNERRDCPRCGGCGDEPDSVKRRNRAW